MQRIDRLEACPTGMPRSAYIHVPFCRHRCAYCNFTVLAGRDDLIGAYLEAIEQEMSWLARPREADTLFIGGGTPTHLAPAQLERLLKCVERWFPPAANHEWTIEANPSDVSAEIVELLTAHGVTRVSLGAQSFHAGKLAVLERDHDAETIGRAVEAVREAGAQVSLDLIFAAPGQGDEPAESLESWRDDVARAIALRPDHVSTYGLTYERGARFWSRRKGGDLSQVEEEVERAMYLAAIDDLTSAGCEHYEVSNFARPGHRCRHNEACWLGREYFAAGPGAARYVDGRRETNHRSTTTWLRRVLVGDSPVAESEVLDAETRARERLVFGLRRLEGIDLAAFAAETGYGVVELAGGAIDRFVRLGLLVRGDADLRLTREGLLVSDSLWPELLAPVPGGPLLLRR